FSVVSQLARDFFAIPASVSVQRLFSRSRHLCHEARSSMKAETTAPILHFSYISACQIVNLINVVYITISDVPKLLVSD
ncbi:hypothetical protein B0H19DRAFT_973785, partial [Mycena capillaripes]